MIWPRYQLIPTNILGGVQGDSAIEGDISNVFEVSHTDRTKNFILDQVLFKGRPASFQPMRINAT